MQITTVLFDLDATLLPLDQDFFIKTYFGLLAKFLAPHGYEPQKLVESVYAGTKSMIKNDGSRANEEAFWDTFSAIYGPEARNDLPLFDQFYRTRFDDAKAVCGYNPLAKEAVELCKQKGLNVVVATSPLFPQIAVEKRIGWAGLSPQDFCFYTTYENCRFCKPNPSFYQELADRLQVSPENCLMVGNDVDEDMIAQTLGMKVFLLTDCLLNRNNKDISAYPQGDFNALMQYIAALSQ